MPGFFTRESSGRSEKLATHSHLALRRRMCGAINSTPTTMRSWRPQRQRIVVLVAVAVAVVVVFESALLLLRIRQLPRSNLGKRTGSHDWFFFCYFFQSFPAYAATDRNREFHTLSNSSLTSDPTIRRYTV